MPIPITVPRLGWNMEYGTFVEWLKADGDAVRQGDSLFRLEGEKATEEIESFDAGTLSIPPNAPKPGDRVLVGVVVGYLIAAGECTPLAPRADAEPPANTSVQTPAQPDRSRSERSERSTLPSTPRARRTAAERGIDIATLTGTGRGGRVRERDIPSPSAPALPQLRRTIAARMVASHQTTAPVTLTSAVEASNLVNLRQQFKAAGGAVPSLTDFLVKLTAAALQQHPLLASRWGDDRIHPPVSIDIGVAVDTDAGLLVPVVRDVPSLGLSQVVETTRDLYDRARRGALTADEMRGGCFTITNLGAFGVDAFTPIINPPECAILGVGRVERRPVVRGDEIVIREMTTMSLTFDHRIVDGAPAARFLQTIAKLIENPAPALTT
ncbi:MAG TPA: dihydrolipoamide acetyltransferase family protein [Gemmataceae bacterium]|nr:dihydrolipoamide acetyltransferase family protein [Gemmataceae bacterium]